MVGSKALHGEYCGTGFCDLCRSEGVVLLASRRELLPLSRSRQPVREVDAGASPDSYTCELMRRAKAYSGLPQKESDMLAKEKLGFARPKSVMRI